MLDERQKELLRLVELDYARTSKFIEGLVATGATLRGWAITIWLAVLGVAFDRNTWELAALAAIVILVFAVVDGYHAWLYREAFEHARSLERISSSYYKSLGRGADDPDAKLDLREELEAHRFGLYANLRRFAPRTLLHARPAVFFWFLYPFLALVGAASALFIGLR